MNRTPPLAAPWQIGQALFLVSSLLLAGCYDHECERRTTRCHLGEMQECHCKTVPGMIAANSCTEPARWRPIRARLVGCIDTPGGPRGSRETCPQRGMPDYCEEGRAISCADSANGKSLAFATKCTAGNTCRIDDQNAAACVPAGDVDSSPALLLYASHPVKWDGSTSWAPAHLPSDAKLHSDSEALVVVLLDDRVRAYRGGSIPIAEQGTRVSWPRESLARFLATPRTDESILGTIVSDTENAIRHQTFYTRMPEHLDTIVRASALWHAGEPGAAQTLIDRALAEAPTDEGLQSASVIIAGLP